MKIFFLSAIAIALTACHKASDDASQEPSIPTEDLSSLPALSSTPLSRSSENTTDHLFEKISSEHSGINFVHSWKPQTAYETQLLKTGFTGGGVCMGDYDRDGRCDMLLTRPYGGPVLYRNLGDFKFEDTTKAAKLHFPKSLTGGCTMADVNNDGWLDLYICAYDSENLLFLNQGDGTFLPATGKKKPHHAGASVKTIFADYDRDGDLDAFIVTNRLEPKSQVKIPYQGTHGNYTVPEAYQELVGIINLPDRQQFVKGAQFDHLYRNDLSETGKLTWTNITKTAGITGNFHGLDAIWWDYNNDFYPDLYIANDFTDPDQFLRNNGDGTFTDISKEALPHTPWFTMGAAIADFDGDGRTDLLSTDMSATTHYREKIAMGSMDAVGWFLDWAEPRQYMRNALYLNSGTERFMEAAYLTGLASSNWTWSVKAADLDCDGLEDTFFTNGFPRDYNNVDFAMELRRSGDQDPNAWLKAPELREKNLAFRNQGDLSFSETGEAWGIGEEGISFGSALGDLDGDGDLDLVVNHFDASPSLFQNHSSVDTHRLRVQLVGRDGSNRLGIGARVEIKLPSGLKQHRDFHPGNGFMSADEPAITFGLGKDTTVAKLTVHWPSGKVQHFENLKADHNYTIAEEGTTPAKPESTAPLFSPSGLLAKAIHREVPFDDFKVQPLLPNKLSQLGPPMAWGDINGDGKPDFFLGGATGQAGQLYQAGENGTYDAVSIPALEADQDSEDIGALLADLDGDSDLDLFVTSGGVESSALQDRLYLNDGKGHFTPAPNDTLPELADSSGTVTASDFDQDGDLDLFVAGRCVPGSYPSSPASRLLMNEGGRFSDATAQLAPHLLEAGMITDATWSDVNQDGWIDLLLTTDYGAIQTHLNRAGKALEDTTADSGIANLTGWWNTIEPIDLDSDGDLDFVVGNLGLNTKYQPSAKKPQVIFYGDFTGDGKATIVEAKPSKQGLLPVRGRSCSSNAMPFLKKKFPTYHDFAIASLSEIYTPEKLTSSLRLEATTAESGILINDGTGKFTFRPLPRLAQISPIRDIAIIDANADGKADLFLAQNFFTPQRETGRMDGGMGLLLLAQENGSFLPLSPAQSGITLPDDAVTAQAIDLNGDGQKDLAISTNNGPIRTFIRLK